VAPFENQQDISLSQEYGCFFASPQASIPFQPDVRVCGYAVWKQFFEEVSDSAKRQYSYDALFSPSVSNRAGLLIIFLIKEGNLLTAWGVRLGLYLSIYIAQFLVAVVLAPLLFMVYMSSSRMRMFKHYYVEFAHVVDDQVEVLSRMCLNFSSIYKIGLFGRSLWMGLVNDSIRVRTHSSSSGLFRTCMSRKILMVSL
jgi:hypothetical protein